MIQLSDPHVAAFLATVRETKDVGHSLGFVDWLQENGGTFADVLRLYAGTPCPDEPRRHHTDGIPKECVAAASRAMVDQYPSVQPGQVGFVTDPRTHWPTPAWYVVAGFRPPRWVLPEPVVRAIDPNCADASQLNLDGFVGFAEVNHSRFVIYCRSRECNWRPVDFREANARSAMLEMPPQVVLERNTLSGDGERRESPRWYRNYWTGRCERCGATYWSKEDDGAEDRELRRRVLELFGGLLAAEKRYVLHDKLLMSLRVENMGQFLVDALRKAGFRLDDNERRLSPVRVSEDKRDRSLVYTQTITADQLIPPEPWDAPQYGESRLRGAFGPYATRREIEEQLQQYADRMSGRDRDDRVDALELALRQVRER